MEPVHAAGRGSRQLSRRSWPERTVGQPAEIWPHWTVLSGPICLAQRHTGKSRQPIRAAYGEKAVDPPGNTAAATMLTIFSPNRCGNAANISKTLRKTQPISPKRCGKRSMHPWCFHLPLSPTPDITDNGEKHTNKDRAFKGWPEHTGKVPADPFPVHASGESARIETKQKSCTPAQLTQKAKSTQINTTLSRGCSYIHGIWLPKFQLSKITTRRDTHGRMV